MVPLLAHGRLSGGDSGPESPRDHHSNGKEHVPPDSRTAPAGDDQYPSAEEEVKGMKARGMVPGLKV